MALRLINESTGATVASQVELALDRASRKRGLLGRASLAPASALVLSPCWMVHTAFMQFAIDVLFVNGHGEVVHLVPGLPPWRAAVSVRARGVIEMPAGTAAQCGISVGDRVSLAADGLAPELTVSARSLPLEMRAC